MTDISVSHFGRRLPEFQVERQRKHGLLARLSYRIVGKRVPKTLQIAWILTWPDRPRLLPGPNAKGKKNG